MTDPFRLLLIGDSDSQLLACEALCRFPEDLAVEVTINAIPRDGTPEPILRRAENLGRLWRLEMGQLLMHPDLMQFDAIGVFLTGSKISDVRLALGLLPAGERPLLFCGQLLPGPAFGRNHFIHALLVGLPSTLTLAAGLLLLRGEALCQARSVCRERGLGSLAVLAF